MAMGSMYGLQGLLKEGHKHLSGVEEAVLKNIDACKELSHITRTSLGPNGMNKMIINHLDKLFVTGDAATLVQELEVQHPAAKLLVLAGKAQQEEVGDGANTVITVAGELLQGAEELIRSGLHPSEIVAGYAKAAKMALEMLPHLCEPGSDKIDIRNESEVVRRIQSAVGSKLYGKEGVLCPLIAQACIQVCPKNPLNFNIDNVRVCKILGGSLHGSCVIPGLVLKSDAAGTIKHAKNAKIAVFGAGIDTSATETKGTVLIENAEQLEGYGRTEEAKVEEMIRAVAEAGATVVVSGQAVGEMAQHFCERYNLMVLKILSKFELRRFCRTTGAVSLVRLQQPSPDELGFADSVSVEEIGGTKVVIVKNETGGNLVSTIVLRGATDTSLDDVERGVDDGINSFKALGRDARVLPGGGATEMELAVRLKERAKKETGLDQHAVVKFAECLEVVPRILIVNAGADITSVISSLYSSHAASAAAAAAAPLSSSDSPSTVTASPEAWAAQGLGAGVDVEEGKVKDMRPDNVWDLYLTKFWALKLAADAVWTVLRVDQIIMAKIAGGPRRADRPMDEGDD